MEILKKKGYIVYYKEGNLIYFRDFTLVKGGIR